MKDKRIKTTKGGGLRGLGVKENRTNTYRISGVVVDEKKKVIGYMLMDLRTNQQQLFNKEQIVFLVGKKTIENAELQGGEIRNTECAMTRLPQLDKSGRVVANKGITILAVVELGTKKGYRVMDGKGKVVEMEEGVLIGLLDSKGIELVNAKKVTRGDKQYIAAIRGSFKVIQKKQKETKVERPQEAEQTGQDERANKWRKHEKEIYLEKIRKKLKVTIKRGTFKNWNTQGGWDPIPTREGPHKKLEKGVKRFSREYVDERDTKLKGIAEEVMGGGGTFKKALYKSLIYTFKEMIQEETQAKPYLNGGNILYNNGVLQCIKDERFIEMVRRYGYTPLEKYVDLLVDIAKYLEIYGKKQRGQEGRKGVYTYTYIGIIREVKEEMLRDYKAAKGVEEEGKKPQAGANLEKGELLYEARKAQEELERELSEEGINTSGMMRRLQPW